MLMQILRNLFFFALHVDSGTIFPKPLSPAEEQECFRKMAEGDDEQRKLLIEHNLRLVAHPLTSRMNLFPSALSGLSRRFLLLITPKVQNLQLMRADVLRMRS